MAQEEQKRREKGDPCGRSKSNDSTFGSGVGSWWPILIPMLCALWTYHAALDGAFVFDDVPAIVDNASLETLGGFWEAAFGPTYSPISNRPVVCLTFALNHFFGGRETYGYHLLNLLIHAVNSALLALVIRRTLTAPNLGDVFTPARATWTATVIALVWSVHPLATEAVTYITQRTTLMMSLFSLLMLYGTLRSATDTLRPHFWTWFAVAACAFAMMSKEEAVGLPILIVLFDRAYLYRSFTAARERRTVFYGMLAATWLLLIACVTAGPTNPTVGYNTIPKLGPFEWLMTEARVLVHYLRLTFWPRPLSVAYDWPFVRNLSDVLEQGSVIVTLLAATVALWFRRPHWAWLGALFFLLLAPTSSVVPIITEAIAERRMYLPMLATLIPVLLGVLWLANRLTLAMFGPAPRGNMWLAAPLALLVFFESTETARYAEVFNNEKTLWTDVAKKNELTNRSFMSGVILRGLVKPWLDQGRYDKAVPLLEEAVACEAPLVDNLVDLAAVYDDTGKYVQAEALYQRALRSDPDHANALNNYGKLMLDLYQNDPPEKRLGPNDPRMQVAYEKSLRAIQLNPRSPAYYNNFGLICYQLGRVQEADQAWLTALQLDPTNIGAALNRATMLAKLGRTTEALTNFESIYQREPQHSAVLINLVTLHLQLGNRQEALDRVHNTLRVNPNHPTALALLRELTQTGK